MVSCNLPSLHTGNKKNKITLLFQLSASFSKNYKSLKHYHVLEIVLNTLIYFFHFNVHYSDYIHI